MFKVSIITNGQETHGQPFSSLAQAEAWVSEIEAKANNPWGKLERLVPTEQCTEQELLEALETIPAILEGELVVQPEMKRLPKTYEVSIQDITAQHAAQVDKEAKILAGKKAREACQTVLDLIAGYNLDRQLTQQQITQMQIDFYNAEQALRTGRPTTAKALIEAIAADEVLVTSEMKSACLQILEDY